jgi:hypothetical protein
MSQMSRLLELTLGNYIPFNHIEILANLMQYSSRKGETSERALIPFNHIEIVANLIQYL